eukprot:gene10956-22888_t
MADLVSIRQRGRQSKQLVEIVGQLAAGTPMTHILNYKVSTQTQTESQALAIRRALRDSIWEQTITEQIAAVVARPNRLYPVPVTWSMPNAGATCAYYYTDAGLIFSDQAIQRHTQLLLSRITSRIRLQHPEYGNDWGLAFLVSRVLDAAFLAPMAAPQVMLDAASKEEDDEEEEEE